MRVKYSSSSAEKQKEMNVYILFSDFLEDCEGKCDRECLCGSTDNVHLECTEDALYSAIKRDLAAFHTTGA